MTKFRLLAFISLIAPSLFGQTFSRKDSLQGSLRPERTCFDVQHYALNITLHPDTKTIVGYNDINFKVVEATSKIQLDLFANMKVDSIVFNQKQLKYVREFDAVFINFPKPLEKDATETLRFYYSGKPVIAKNAPWDGGFVWKTDGNGKPFIGVAVQGTGASLWFPVKDHQSDEPDLGTTIKVAVPNGLMNVSNGRYKGNEDLKNGYTRWDWEVKSPINNYTITLNIADYVHIHETLDGLDLDYYVLRENEAIARKHFEEVKPMMVCFQEKFGTYPFAEDGYKLVETPYLGMEHQSAVAYGNKYMKGYLGRDLSGTGIGMKFDYITIHETAHEWFGNSITSKDIADMWIHEGFTTYAESVFVECQFGYEEALAYVNGEKRAISNRSPVIGQFGVNYKSGNSDMYYKGANFLNTLRHVINNDEHWWKILKSYSLNYRHKIIETNDVVQFFNKESGMNLSPLFHQYLLYRNVPKLEVLSSKKKLAVRWVTDLENFEMPVEYSYDGKTYRMTVTNTWNELPKNIKNAAGLKFNQEKMLFTLQH